MRFGESTRGRFMPNAGGIRIRFQGSKGGPMRTTNLAARKRVKIPFGPSRSPVTRKEGVERHEGKDKGK